MTSGVTLAPGEQQRIDAAMKTLEGDCHAPREITVRVVLTVFREYPKHVPVGLDKDGNVIIKVAENAEEEESFLGPIVLQAMGAGSATKGEGPGAPDPSADPPVPETIQ